MLITFIMGWVILSFVMTSGFWLTGKFIKSLFPYWWQRHVAREMGEVE